MSFRLYCVFRLGSLVIQLKTCRLADVEEVTKEFAAKLAMVPVPPPGLLHLVCVAVTLSAFSFLSRSRIVPVSLAKIMSVLQSFSLRPLSIILPSQEDKDHPVIDLDLHLPFLCFKPLQLLQVSHTASVIDHYSSL